MPCMITGASDGIAAAWFATAARRRRGGCARGPPTRPGTSACRSGRRPCGRARACARCGPRRRRRRVRICRSSGSRSSRSGRGAGTSARPGAVGLASRRPSSRVDRVDERLAERSIGRRGLRRSGSGASPSDAPHPAASRNWTSPSRGSSGTVRGNRVVPDPCASRTSSDGRAHRARSRPTDRWRSGRPMPTSRATTQSEKAAHKHEEPAVDRGDDRRRPGGRRAWRRPSRAARYRESPAPMRMPSSTNTAAATGWSAATNQSTCSARSCDRVVVGEERDERRGGAAR